MKKKGFTLVELLVVVAIIALLVAILAPALAKVKQQAERMVCGTNLRGLGNACMVYATSFEDEYPIQGGDVVEHIWGIGTAGWWVDNYQFSEPETPITVGASLYLLIREADVTPKQFVCPSGDEKAYDGENPDGLDIVEVYDFGQYREAAAGPGQGPQHGPQNHASYSYQLPYDNSTTKPAYPPDSSADASVAIMADKNPWFDPELNPVTTPVTPGMSGLDSDTYSSSVAYIYWRSPDSENPDSAWERWMVEIGNAQPHLRQGQEVLWGDSHVTFEKRPDCGVRDDNIYVPCGGEDPPFGPNQRRRGDVSLILTVGEGYPKHALDNYLVNDDWSDRED